MDINVGCARGDSHSEEPFFSLPTGAEALSWNWGRGTSLPEAPLGSEPPLTAPGPPSGRVLPLEARPAGSCAPRGGSGKLWPSQQGGGRLRESCGWKAPGTFLHGGSRTFLHGGVGSREEEHFAVSPGFPRRNMEPARPALQRHPEGKLSAHSWCPNTRAVISHRPVIEVTDQVTST